MADIDVEVRFGFIRTITCDEFDVANRIESMRRRFERELQLATKDNGLKLRASKGVTAPPAPRLDSEAVKLMQSFPKFDQR